MLSFFDILDNFPLMKGGENPIIRGVIKKIVQPYSSNIPIDIYPKIADKIKVISIASIFDLFFIL